MSADYCPCCQRPFDQSAAVERWGLRLEPIALLSWNGRSERLSVGPARVIEALLRGGSVSNEYLEMNTVRGEATEHARWAAREYVKKLRRTLRAIGCPLLISSVYGQGYVIERPMPVSRAA